MRVPWRFYLPLCALWILGMILPVLTRAQAQEHVPTARLDASLRNPSAVPRALAFGTQTATAKAPKPQSLRQMFLAQTKVQQEDQGAAKNTFRCSFLFPTKTTAELTLTIQPNQFHTPTPQESKASGTGAKAYGLKTTNDVKTNSYTLSYFVPYSSLPPDVVQQLRGMATGSAALDRSTGTPHLRLAAYAPGARTEAADGGGQESSGQGEEGASVNASLSSGASSVSEGSEWLESLMEGMGLEVPESLEVANSLLSSGLNVNAALTLDDTDSALLAQFLALQYCAHNLSSLGLNEPPGLADLESSVDNIVNWATSGMGDQFFLTLVSEATSVLGSLKPFLNSVVAEPLAAKQQASANDIAQLLAQLRALLPYCSGMWYGNFHVIATNGLQKATDDSSGSVYFTVNNGQATGKIENARDKFTMAGSMICTGEGTFSADLPGNVIPAPPSMAGGGPPYVANLTSGPPSPANFPMQCSIPGAMSWAGKHPSPSVSLSIYLSNGLTHDYTFPNVPEALAGPSAVPPEVPATVAAAVAGLHTLSVTGHVTVTVMKLQ